MLWPSLLHIMRSPPYMKGIKYWLAPNNKYLLLICSHHSFRFNCPKYTSLSTHSTFKPIFIYSVPARHHQLICHLFDNYFLRCYYVWGADTSFSIPLKLISSFCSLAVYFLHFASWSVVTPCINIEDLFWKFPFASSTLSPNHSNFPFLIFQEKHSLLFISAAVVTYYPIMLHSYSATQQLLSR